MKFLVIILSIVLASQTMALTYTDCGSNSGEIQDVRLTGCEDNDVCQLKRGETYTVGLTFKSLTNSQKVRAALYGIVDGVTYPYPLPNSDFCETGDIQCPIKDGEVYSFDKTFEVSRSYPSLRLDVKWELKNDDNDNIVCGILPVEIV